MERTNEKGQSSKTAGEKEKRLPYSVETPYGFHLDLDFLKYVDDIEKGNTIKRIHVSRRAKQPKFSTLPRNFSVPDNRPRAYASSASYSGDTTTRSSTPMREPIEVKETPSSLPINSSSQHLKHLHELNYRWKTNLVETSSLAETFLNDGHVIQKEKPHLFRASSMPAELPQNKSTEEHSQSSILSEYPVTFQPSDVNNLPENVFQPLEEPLIANHKRHLELTPHKAQSNMAQQIKEALERIKELEEQVKTIPGLNQQILILTEEKLQLTNQLQIHQETNAALLSMESDRPETISCQKLVTEASTSLTVSGVEPVITESQPSEGIELSITESEHHNSIDSDVKSIEPSLAKHNVNLEPLLNVSLERMVSKALRQRTTILEKQLNEKTEELEQTKRMLKQRDDEIEARGRSFKELKSTNAEENTKESKIAEQPDLQYHNVAVNTRPLHAKGLKEACDKGISVNISPDTQSVGCGECVVNILGPQVKEMKSTLATVDIDNQARQSTTDKEADPGVVSENLTGTSAKSHVESVNLPMSDAVELKIEEHVYECELQRDLSAVESHPVGASSKTNGNGAFALKNGGDGNEHTTKEQVSSPDATVGQYVKKIQELIHEQWTCLEHGYPELAHAIRQPASKLSSIQNQLVNSLNLLSSIYTSQTPAAEENVKTKCQEMETSPTTSLKSIMKKKGHGFHARGNGAKKNLQFVGVNGGYETTSSEEGSSSEEYSDHETEGKCDHSEQKHGKAASTGFKVAPDMTHVTKNKDREPQELEDPSMDSTEHHPERCKPKEDFLRECQLLSNHLSELSSTPDKETRELLSVVCKEWFRVSSQKSSSSCLVEAYLKEFSVISLQLLEKVLNMADGNGNTALHYSVSHSNFSIVKLLLDTGVCDVNHQNKAGYTAVMLTPLASAETDTDMEVVLRLLKQGDVNTRASKRGQTALMLGVSHGRSDMVKVLLSCGADVNIQDDDGNSALMIACQYGHAEIVKLLLAQPGCNVALTDKVSNFQQTVFVHVDGHQITFLVLLTPTLPPPARRRTNCHFSGAKFAGGQSPPLTIL